VLAVCVVVHLVTIVYAVRGGLTAVEILSRTRGSVGWLAFYTIFVLAVAVHAPIGLRPVMTEWLGWRGRSRDLFAVIFAAVIAWMGMRAVLVLYV
jgi:fumarate reductase subunit C